MLDKRLGMICF